MSEIRFIVVLSALLRGEQFKLVGAAELFGNGCPRLKQNVWVRLEVRELSDFQDGLYRFVSVDAEPRCSGQRQACAPHGLFRAPAHLRQ